MKSIRCASRSVELFNYTHRAIYCTHSMALHRSSPEISKSTNSGVDSDSRWGENGTIYDFHQQASIGSILQKIADRAGRKGPPLSTFLESAGNKDSSVLKRVLYHPMPFVLQPNVSFCDWIDYVESVAPASQRKDSELVVKNIVKILNEKQDAPLHNIKMRLSVPDVVKVVTALRNPTTAFVFYKWVRRQSFFIPHKTIYKAVIMRLIASTDLDSWDQLHVVMNGMIRRAVFIGNVLFRKLLWMASDYGLKHACSIPRMQRFVDWLLRMTNIGFVSWIPTYKQVMKRCNLLGMYESTLRVFENIPDNTYAWSFTTALFACRGMDNLYLAEEVLHKMKEKNLEPDAKCFNILLELCADHGTADKTERYLEQMKELRFLVNIRPYTSVILAYGKEGCVKQAEDIFQRLEGKLNPAIYGAMLACYRDAGYLLSLLKEANGSLLDATFEACVEKRQWTMALEIIKCMQACGISPEPRLYHMILLVCSNVDDFSACEGLVLDVRKMDYLSSEEIEIIIKMSFSIGRISSALDALELINEQQLDPPTGGFFDECICLSSKNSLPNAVEMYNIMRSIGHLPSSDVFTILIQEHIKAGDVLQSKKLYDDMIAAGLQPEEHITTLMQNRNEETLQNST